LQVGARIGNSYGPALALPEKLLPITASAERTHGGGLSMTRITAILVLVATFLMVAPVIESGSQSRIPVFQAVGNAADSDGGGGW
jgi:hypothetical protein